MGLLLKIVNLFTLGQKKKKMLQKNTQYSFLLSTLPHNFQSKIKSINTQDIKHKVGHLVLLDMLLVLKMWRHIRGYPVNGQTTYTNANSSKKNKTLLNFRLDQFYSLFGKKKRNIFPTLIQAEYTNRLWHNLWFLEWAQGTQFVFSLVNPNKQTIPFDPVSLAKGQTNGYVRVGNAAKIGKAKKITKQCTIGVPLFFTRYIYAELLPAVFPYRLLIADDLRKKMGKKMGKKKMLTKNFNIYIHNFKFVNLLWSKYVKQKVLKFEQTCRDDKLIELQEKKSLLLNELLVLEVDSELLTEDELATLSFKKLEVSEKLEDLEGMVLACNKSYDNFCNILPLLTVGDLLPKYINIFQTTDYKLEFLRIVSLPMVKFNNSIINLTETITQSNNLIHLISYQKHPVHFLYYLESLKQISKDYLFVSSKKKKKNVE